MATANDRFPSNYLRAADLNGRELVVTIDRVEEAEFENDGKKKIKPVVYFRDEGVKPMVTNKTNFLLIAGICGEDDNAWPGKKICLYPDMVAFKGNVSEAIRVKRPPQAPAMPTPQPPAMVDEAHTAAAAAQAPLATAPAAEASPQAKDPNDEIPY